MKGINKVGLYTISDPFEDMYEMNALADEMNAKRLRNCRTSSKYSLDAKQMKDAIKTLITMGEKGGHSLASEQIGRKQLVHIIRSMDIDDDEDHEPIPF